MAALQKLADQFLTCIVCHDVFKDPITLHCGHSFCGACITSYVLNRPDSQADKSIPCPNCRGNTKVPDPSKPVTEWAGQLKTGFFVKDLVETFVADEAAQDTVFCSVCKEEGGTTPADKWCTDCNEALCSKCLDLHTKYPKFRQHKTQEIGEGIKSQKSAEKHFCSEHKDEKLKLFCKDCDLAICQLCCSVFHRKCDSIVTITEAYPQMKQDLVNKVQDMQFASVDDEAVMSKRKSQLKMLMDSCDKAVNDIDAASEELVKVVQTKQDKMKKKLRTLTDHAARMLTNDLETASSNCKGSERDIMTIQSAIQGATEIELYDTYKDFCSKRNPDLPEKEDRSTPPRIIEILFSSNAAKLTNTLHSLNIGSISTVFDKEDETSEASESDPRSETKDDPESKGKGLPKSSKGGRRDKKHGPNLSRASSTQGLEDKGKNSSKFASAENVSGMGGREKRGPKGKHEKKGDKSDGDSEPRPVFIERIDTKADIDPNDSQIKDIIIIPDGNSVIIAFTDAPNKKVKALYLQTGQKTFIEFQYPPFGLTQISPNEIAVAVRFAFRIYIIKLRPQLQIVSHIDTKEGYTNICHIDTNKYVASSGAKNIDILDPSGAVTKRIENENISASILYKANLLGQFLVCDPLSHSVSRVSTNNKVSFKFEPFGKHQLINTVGACVDRKGNIYVVNAGLNKVIMLNGAGKYSRDVLTLNEKGEKLSFINIDQNNRMYLTYEGRLILVYQLM